MASGRTRGRGGDGSEPLAQPVDPAEICKAALPRFVGEAHDDIHVGVRPVVATRDRADQGQAGDSGPLELVLVRAQCADDLIVTHDLNFTAFGSRAQPYAPAFAFS